MNGRQEMKTIENPSEYLVDSGILFEINRTIMHPLGLALAVTMPGNNPGHAMVSIIDGTDDPEGMYFSEESRERGKKKFDKTIAEAGKRAYEAKCFLVMKGAQ